MYKASFALGMMTGEEAEVSSRDYREPKTDSQGKFENSKRRNRVSVDVSPERALQYPNKPNQESYRT